ncbi:unnamed protein product [Ranitomeya imitator]|uniref:DUF1731 domain-containing protein n=1 Tax=Ranitomeya imitator TaxID=111125 RepID=A0ABN9LSM3_9NEOB|nr:unnamed protein product [Ranitomeya imitator]
MEAGEFLCSVDIQDAYLHVPICVRHHRFLLFAIKDNHYQFSAIPFGLASAPQGFLQDQGGCHGHPSFQRDSHYPLPGRSVDQGVVLPRVCSVSRFLWTLTRIGWIINRSNSSLSPSQCLSFLGMEFDTNLAQLFLLKDKFAVLLKAVRSLKRPAPRLLWFCMGVLGMMVASMEALPFAQFHTRLLLSTWNRSMTSLDRPIRLPLKVRRSLSWWTLSSSLLRGRSFLPLQWHVITTDASLLRSIFLALLHWQSLLTGLPVRIQSDNATAFVYLNHQGRTRSGQVMAEAAKILWWAERHVPAISAVHIPGVENWAADFLSRQGLAKGEWSLHPAVFNQICLRWGTPVVDLMASRMNHKVPQFVARSWDHLAVGHGALSGLDLGLSLSTLKDQVPALSILFQRDLSSIPQIKATFTLAFRQCAVLGRNGGPFPKMLWPFRFCLGGVLGSGKQPFPWIHIEDLCRLLCYTIEQEGKVGSILNAVSPSAVTDTNADFTRVLSKALGRPAFLFTPDFAVQLLFGSDRAPMLLEGPRVVPQRTLKSGFSFLYPNLDSALAQLLS